MIYSTCKFLIPEFHIVISQEMHLPDRMSQKWRRYYSDRLSNACTHAGNTLTAARSLEIKKLFFIKNVWNVYQD